MKDITIRSVIAGVVAVLAKDFFDLIYINFGLSDISMIKVAAGTFISLNNYYSSII